MFWNWMKNPRRSLTRTKCDIITLPVMSWFWYLPSVVWHWKVIYSAVWESASEILTRLRPGSSNFKTLRLSYKTIQSLFLLRLRDLKTFKIARILNPYFSDSLKVGEIICIYNFSSMTAWRWFSLFSISLWIHIIEGYITSSAEFHYWEK